MSDVNSTALSSDIKQLHSIVSHLQLKVHERDQKIRERDEEIEELKELNRFLRLAKYASSQSERDVGHTNQLKLELFNEAELENEIAKRSERIQVKAHTKENPRRKPLPENLPRERVVIELPQDQRQCSCGCELKEIGSEISEELDVIPMQMKVIQTIRMKYGCQSCNTAPKRAPLPPKLIPKSNATPGLLATIAVSKYADALPLYRQEQIFARHGIELPRSTTSSWMIICGQAMIPIINLMWDDLLSDSYVQMDETKVQVLKEAGKKSTTKSWMWTTARAGPKPIVIFEYDPTRSKSVPNRLLEGFEGYLQCDGYASYDEICRKPRVIRVGCGYHIRRKFKETEKVTKDKTKKGLALEVVEAFKPIFEIEEMAREKRLSPEERFELRQRHAKPLLEDLKKWLDGKSETVLPKGKLGKAIQYARNEWKNFTRYLDDGRLEIGTIYTENKIRPFAVGRRNWLFCLTPDGANASAALYSIVETAKANGLNPHAYLKFLFTAIPTAKTVDDFAAMLPWNVKTICQ